MNLFISLRMLIGKQAGTGCGAARVAQPAAPLISQSAGVRGSSDQSCGFSVFELQNRRWRDQVFKRPVVGWQKRRGHRLLGRGKTVSQAAATERRNAALAGELGQLAVHIHPVDALPFQDDMFLLELGQAYRSSVSFVPITSAKTSKVNHAGA
jgi:hypothetical protein